MQFKHIILSLFSVCLIFPLFAQQEMGLYFMNDSWQSNKLNPAFFPQDKKLIIGLPGIHSNAFISNFTPNDILEKGDDGRNILNANRIIDQLEEVNTLRENYAIETISIGYKTGALQISLSHGFNFNGYTTYPKTLPELVWEGNSQFIGQDVAFGPSLELSGYHEIALGLGYNISPNVTIAGKIKYLSGAGNISTEREALSLFTDPDSYELNLNSDFLLNSSGFLDYSGLLDFQVDVDLPGIITDGFFSSNTGLAFDLGFHAKFDKLELSASVLDIGQIDWKENPENYSLTGTRSFPGLDALQSLLEDSTSIGSVLDTLESIYEPETTLNEYTTKLPLRAYFGLGYQLNETWKVGGTFYFENYRDETFIAAALGLQGKLADWLTVGANYSYRNETYDNLGINALLSFGPAQVLLATDNVLAPLQLGNSYSANARIGLNLAFGAAKAQHWDEVEQTDDFFNN